MIEDFDRRCSFNFMNVEIYEKCFKSYPFFLDEIISRT